MQTQSNKFDALQEITDDEYEDIVNAHLEVAAECISPK